MTAILVTDGVVLLRATDPDDVPALIAGRDAAFHRWLGQGSDAPNPTACIEVAGQLAGWVDYERAPEHDWLQPGEVNLGYQLFAAQRGRGYAVRAVQLLLHHLAMRTQERTATLLIHPDNAPSLALAARARFVAAGEVRGSLYFTRAVPPLTCSDGVLTIRAQRATDLEQHLAAIDARQMQWLWLPEQRAQWQAMSRDDQRMHVLAGLQHNAAAFGAGPKWTFAADLGAASCIAYVDCDLDNEHVPAGEANISYAVHPAYRGRGLARRAVRCVLDFLRDHTGARAAHIIVDAQNSGSLQVARSFVSAPTQQWRDAHGRTLIRHVIELY